MSEELAVIVNAAQTVGASIEGPLRWLEQRLVVARGPYAPERFDDSDKVELTEVEAAWGFASSKLSQRELLYMGGIGGHPGAAGSITSAPTTCRAWVASTRGKLTSQTSASRERSWSPRARRQIVK